MLIQHWGLFMQRRISWPQDYADYSQFCEVCALCSKKPNKVLISSVTWTLNLRCKPLWITLEAKEENKVTCNKKKKVSLPRGSHGCFQESEGKKKTQYSFKSVTWTDVKVPLDGMTYLELKTMSIRDFDEWTLLLLKLWKPGFPIL